MDEFDENFLEPEVESRSLLHHRHHKFNYFVIFELKDEVDDLIHPLTPQSAIQDIFDNRTQQFLQFPRRGSNFTKQLEVVVIANFEHAKHQVDFPFLCGLVLADVVECSLDSHIQVIFEEIKGGFDGGSSIYLGN